MMSKRIVGGLVLVLILAGSARGEVVATARSPEGIFSEFRVVLDAVGAPVAVANFMGLVDGSQRWVDPETGALRGGEGDAYYDGMGFDWNAGSVLRGGLREVTGTNGVAEYAGKPGYTIPSEVGASGWNEVEEGTLAMVERIPTWPGMRAWLGWELDVMHSGGGELALFLTNGVAAWTVFGHVAAGDESGLRALAERVAANEGTAVAVEWTVDASDATEEELAALAEGRSALPEAQWIEARQGVGGMSWGMPGKSWAKTAACTNLLGEWSEREWWDDAEARDVGWEAFGLEGPMGFAWERFAGVRYPQMGRPPLQGKWLVGVDHTGKRMQYWLDFDGGTGMWASVESGTITEGGFVSHVEQVRETANSLRVWFSVGQNILFYWFGVVGDDVGEGRFQSAQVTLQGSTRDSGTYEWEEGWGDAGENGAKKLSRRLSRKGESQMPILGRRVAEGEKAGDGGGRGRGAGR